MDRDPRDLRIVTLNLWGIEPPLDRRLALAAVQLRALAPDVIALQEVRPLARPGEQGRAAPAHGGAESIGGAAGRTTADVLAAALAMHAHYAVAVRWDAGEEGLALLTREPLLAAESLALPDRRPGDARILLSGQVATVGGPIWVHTTHLHYRLDDGVAREAQVAALDASIRRRGRDATDSPQILCGDFNATPDSDEMRFLRGLHTLNNYRTHFQDAWLRLHPEPQVGDGPEHGITWSSENELTRPLRSLDIDRRIDYVYVTSRKKDGRATVRRCAVVLRERDDSLGGICASDHFGVLADIQVVPGV